MAHATITIGVDNKYADLLLGYITSHAMQDEQIRDFIKFGYIAVVENDGGTFATFKGDTNYGMREVRLLFGPMGDDTIGVGYLYELEDSIKASLGIDTTGSYYESTADFEYVSHTSIFLGQDIDDIWVHYWDAKQGPWVSDQSYVDIRTEVPRGELLLGGKR